jgi:hypothetical protein
MMRGGRVSRQVEAVFLKKKGDTVSGISLLMNR